MKALPVLGYFTSPNQATPAVDPPWGETDCPVCGEPLIKSDMRTVSVMPVGGKTSAFYRLHRTCALAISPAHAALLDDVALWILASRATPPSEPTAYRNIPQELEARAREVMGAAPSEPTTCAKCLRVEPSRTFCLSVPCLCECHGGGTGKKERT